MIAPFTYLKEYHVAQETTWRSVASQASIRTRVGQLDLFKLFREGSFLKRGVEQFNFSSSFQLYSFVNVNKVDIFELWDTKEFSSPNLVYVKIKWKFGKMHASELGNFDLFKFWQHIFYW